MGVLTHQISEVFTDPAPTEIYKILHVIVTIACAMVGYVVLVKAFGIWGLLKQVLKKD
ncbi:MAG: hypothetical protein R3A45_08700 [Bdellovibrionota bacterium]